MSRVPTTRRWTATDLHIADSIMQRGPLTREQLEHGREVRAIHARLDEFMRDGKLVERADDTIAFAPSWRQTLGIYVGNASVRLALVDVNGEEVEQDTVDNINYRTQSFVWLLQRIYPVLKAMLERAGYEFKAKNGARPRQQHALCGVTMALPTLVDPLDGGGRLAAVYPRSWREEPLSRCFAEELGPLVGRTTPLSFDMDAAADLLAEIRYGDCVEQDSTRTDVLLVKCSGGISAAFLAGGLPYRGTGPGSAGLGHVVADTHGVDEAVGGLVPFDSLRTVCSCGRKAGHARPHLDQIASGRAIADRIGVDVEDEEDFVAYRSALEELDSLRELSDPSEVRTPIGHAVTQAGVALGRAIDGAVATLSPRTVILSGFLTRSGDILRRAVEDELQSREIRTVDHRPIVRLGMDFDSEERKTLGARGAARISLTQIAYPRLIQELRDSKR